MRLREEFLLFEVAVVWFIYMTRGLATRSSLLLVTSLRH